MCNSCIVYNVQYATTELRAVTAEVEPDILCILVCTNTCSCPSGRLAPHTHLKRSYPIPEDMPARADGGREPVQVTVAEDNGNWYLIFLGNSIPKDMQFILHETFVCIPLAI